MHNKLESACKIRVGGVLTSLPIVIQFRLLRVFCLETGTLPDDIAIRNVRRGAPGHVTSGSQLPVYPPVARTPLHFYSKSFLPACLVYVLDILLCWDAFTPVHMGFTYSWVVQSKCKVVPARERRLRIAGGEISIPDFSSTFFFIGTRIKLCEQPCDIALCCTSVSHYLFFFLFVLQSHTILLVQPTKRPEGRTYADYESVNECMEGME